MDVITIKEVRNDVLYLINELREIDKDKAIRSGLYSGGAILKRGGVLRLKLRMKAPYGQKGNLVKSFRVRVKRNKLGVLSGFGYPEGRHSWLLDQGTGSRHTKRYDYRGYGPALGYWKDTKDQDSNKALDSVRKGVEKYVERIKNKG